jgi:hypothetical protein
MLPARCLAALLACLALSSALARAAGANASRELIYCPANSYGYLWCDNCAPGWTSPANSLDSSSCRALPVDTLNSVNENFCSLSYEPYESYYVNTNQCEYNPGGSGFLTYQQQTGTSISIRVCVGCVSNCLSSPMVVTSGICYRSSTTNL